MFSNSTVIIHHCVAVAMFVDQIEGKFNDHSSREPS